MDRWNEGKFVDGVTTGAAQQLTTLRTRQMFTNILRGTNGIAPVSVNQLRGDAFQRPSPGPRLDSDGVSPVREAPWPLPNRTPPHR